MTWLEVDSKIKTLNKKDVVIYDDTHEDGNQHKSVTCNGVFQFKISRPHMNKLKKMGYKVTRRALKK